MPHLSRINHFTDLLITSLCCYILAVDSINGYFLYNSINLPLSISQVFKMLIFSLMTLRILSFKDQRISMVLLYLTILTVPSIASFLEHANFKYLAADFAKTFKVIFIITSYFYFCFIFKQKPEFTLSRIKKIAVYNVFVLSANLILGYFGLGFSQYVGGEGTKGFFYAGNEVSGVLIILFGFILFQLWKKNTKYFYLFALFALGLAVLKATKVAIGGTLLLIVITPFLSEKSPLLKLTKRKFITLFSIAAFSPVLYLLVINGVQYTGLFGRISYFYHKYDLLTFLLSSRNELVNAGLKTFRNDFSLFEKIFGRGLSLFQVGHPDFPGRQTVEIDYFDLLFYYGILGSTLVLLFFMLFIINSLLNINKPYGRWAVFLNILIIGISFTAGHILLSGMAGIFIGMVNSLIFYREKSPNISDI